MSLDDVVLADVESTRLILEGLEDRAYEARAAYHQAIRRLHARGGSMREIATALGMSHQRVHQIIGTDGIVEVEASAVTEVSLLPARAATAAGMAVTAAEDTCSFCGAPRRELDKLLAGPGPVFICGACVAQANLAVQQRSAKGMRTISVDEDATCTFCGNPSAMGGTMAEGLDGSSRICAKCTETCRRLVSNDEPGRPMTRRNSRIRCSFCNISQADTKKLVAGPGVYICESCVAAARAVVTSGAPAKGPRQVVLRPSTDEEHPCTFCDAAGRPARSMVKGGRGRICGTCLALCESVITEGVEHAPPRPRG